MPIEPIQDTLVFGPLGNVVVLLIFAVIIVYLKGQTTIKLARIISQNISRNIMFIVKFISLGILVVVALISSWLNPSLFLIGLYGFLAIYTMYKISEEGEERIRRNQDKLQRM